MVSSPYEYRNWILMWIRFPLCQHILPCFLFFFFLLRSLFFMNKRYITKNVLVDFKASPTTKKLSIYSYIYDKRYCKRKQLCSYRQVKNVSTSTGQYKASGTDFCRNYSEFPTPQLSTNYSNLQLCNVPVILHPV